MSLRHLVVPLLALAVIGCGAEPEGAGPAGGEPNETSPPGASVPGASSRLSRFDPQVDELLARMTLEEKVGQMTQADLSFLDEADVADYYLGSVLSGGGSDPSPENTFEDWRDMVERLEEKALETRLGIPLLYGVDAVHGHANVVGAVVFPHNVGLGAAGDPELVERVYRATAVEMQATGIPWNFAPCVAVARDLRWGRTYEAFSEDPELVAELGAAAVRGLQGADLSASDTVVACAKHWVGDGGTAFGTGAPREGMPDSVFAESGAPEGEGDRWPLDRGDARVDEATLRAVHMPGYLSALEAGVATIMPSFSSWNGELMSGHRYLLTDVLKDELGFEGFLISDWAGIDDLPGDYESDVEQSINAGMDMVMVPDKYREFFTTLVGLVEEGRVPMARIDDAVRRILRVKYALGMFEEDYSPAADPALAARFGGAEHRALGREAVRRSLVLLKNDGALPLAKETPRIHVVGANADDLGNQCGGWTVQWQGASGEITEGTTVLEAIRAAVSDGTEVSYAEDGSGVEGADAVVAVIGETPYAEMFGDRADLALDPDDVATVARAAESGVPVVTVLISGRPLVLGEVLDRSSAVLAAWLPGTEGAGVADVLFGDHPPGGKLAFSWPRSVGEPPLGHDGGDRDPLFPLDYGLRY